MDCNSFDEEMAKEAIEKTNETGREHGFIQCADGSTGEMISGQDDRMSLGNEVETACSSPEVGVFHTHPNGVDDLSDEDRKVLQKHENVSVVCAGVQKMNGKRMYCERSQPTCTAELHQPEPEMGELQLDDGVIFMFPNSEGCRCSAWAKQFDELREDNEQVIGVTTDRPEDIETFADKLQLSYPIVSDPDGAIPNEFGYSLHQERAPRVVAVRRDGETIASYEGPYSYNVAKKALKAYRGELEEPELHVLPKGSKCIKTRKVPSKSDYHNRQFVERCANYATRGEGEKVEWKGHELPKQIGVWELKDTKEERATWVWDRKRMDGGTVITNVSESAEAPGTWGASVGNIDELMRESISPPRIELERAINAVIDFMHQESDGYDPAVETKQPETCLHEPDDEEEPPELLQHIDHPSAIVITGERGSGKSSTAFHIADEMHKHDELMPVVVGMPEHKRKHIPDDWMHVEQIDDAPSDSIVVVDEAYMHYHATEWHDKDAIEMSKLVNLSRHCGRTILFVTQESRQLNKNGVSQADAVLMKKPAPLQIEFERRGMRDLMQKADDSYNQLPDDITHQAYTYVFTGDDVGLVQTGEADFYNDELSRSYSGVCGKTSKSEGEEETVEVEQPESECPLAE